jgi:hypothetical protein
MPRNTTKPKPGDIDPSADDAADMAPDPENLDGVAPASEEPPSEPIAPPAGLQRLPREGSTEDAAMAASEVSYAEQILAVLPKEERGKPGDQLFAEACVAYAINPDPNAHPVEILKRQDGSRWKFVPGNVHERIPDRVVFVTGGGLKVTHPMDADMEERLHKGLFKTTRTRNYNELVNYALPNDLTLPREIVTGIPPKNRDNGFPGGYLRRKAQEQARNR